MKEKGIGMETFLSGTVNALIGARITERSRSGSIETEAGVSPLHGSVESDGSDDGTEMEP